MIDPFIRYRLPQDHPTGPSAGQLYADHNRARWFECRACGSEFTARAPNAEWCGCCRVLRLEVRRAMAAKRLQNA